MERAISIINIMPDTKRGIQLFVDKVLAEIEPREALPLLAKLTAMSEIIDKVKDGIKDQLMDEADLTAEKSFTIDRVRYEKKSRVVHHFHNCEAHEALKSQLKALEDLMKTIKEPVANTDTGEIIPPSLKSYTDYIAVSLPKE